MISELIKISGNRFEEVLKQLPPVQIEMDMTGDFGFATYSCEEFEIGIGDVSVVFKIDVNQEYEYTTATHFQPEEYDYKDPEIYIDNATLFIGDDEVELKEARQRKLNKQLKQNVEGYGY